MVSRNPPAGHPWHAYGLGAGFLAALLLALSEWIRLLVGGSSLQGAAEHVELLASAFTVYGFVTIPLGLGFGLAVAGVSAWLGLPESWRRLASDRAARARHEPTLAALVVAIPVLVGAVGAAAYVGQRAFVRHMNNPTLGAAFMALWVVGALAIAIAFLGVAVIILRGLLVRLPLRSLARREPRLLRGTLVLMGVLTAAVVAAAFAWLYNPEVWPARWVAFLLGTALLPVALTLVRLRVARAGLLRAPAAAASLLLAYLALSAWTFTGINTWDGPRQALLDDSVFAPTLAGLVQRLTDMDGDGQSALLGGGDCDDSNPTVYAGAPEVPGNGIDDNCLGGDAPRTDAAAQAGPLGGADPDGSGAALPTAAAEGTGDTPASTAEGTGASDGTGARAASDGRPAPHRHNILIMLIDTLRPDHLGFFGYDRPISSHMDALAADSIVFDRAYAQAPRTPGSFPSIFTSRYGSHLHFDNPGVNYPNLSDDNLTLFEVLHQSGYYTLGVASHYYFDRAPGITQGFDRFDNRGHLSIAETNTAIAAPTIFAHLQEDVPALAALDQPFCLFVHYFEPHGRWMPHPEVIDFGPTNSGRQRHINDYDSEIAFVDGYIGRTLDLLRDNGLYDDTIVVLIADHGEEFNEHGHYFHGQTLYEEVVRVPFFLRVPGHDPLRVSTPVALLDLAPTLLQLNGIPIPDAFEGRALVPLLPEPPQVDIFTELLPYSSFNEHMTALVRGDEALIYQVTRRHFELYDLASDPGERHDVLRTSPDADALQQRLVSWMEGAE